MAFDSKQHKLGHLFLVTCSVPKAFASFFCPRSLFGLVCLFVACQPVFASTVPKLFQTIAAEYRVPPKILYAISMVESGRLNRYGRLSPWPWTLNIEGEPRYYNTRQAAWFALESLTAMGVDKIDVGLMQINWRYHSQLLTTPWDALDPTTNIKAAAKLLRGHYDKTGNWTAAAGKYHAPNAPSRAIRYANKVLAKLALL